MLLEQAGNNGMGQIRIEDPDLLAQALYYCGSTYRVTAASVSAGGLRRTLYRSAWTVGTDLSPAVSLAMVADCCRVERELCVSCLTKDI